MKDWNFKENLDHIFDVIRKTADVIKSCKTTTHLKAARNYMFLTERYLNAYEMTPRQQAFVDEQMNEFAKMIKIKRRHFRNDIN